MVRQLVDATSRIKKADITDWIKRFPDADLVQIVDSLHELNAIFEIACDQTKPPIESATAACVAFEVGFGLNLFDAAPDRPLYAEFMRRLGPLAKIPPGGFEGPLRLAELRAQFTQVFETLEGRQPRGY